MRQASTRWRADRQVDLPVVVMSPMPTSPSMTPAHLRKVSSS